MEAAAADVLLRQRQEGFAENNSEEELMSGMKRFFLPGVLLVFCFAGLCAAQDRATIEPGGELETDAGEKVLMDFRRYLESKMPPEAEVEEEPVKDEVEDEAEAKSEDKAEDKKEKRISFTFENKINYDSNPDLVSTDVKEDWADIVSFSVGGKFFKKGKNEVGGQYSFYGEFYADVSERNLVGHIADVYYAWLSSPLSIRVDYLYNQFTVNDEVYLNKHTVAPLLFYMAGSRLEMVRIAYSVNSYPDAENLDGSDWSFQVRHFMFFGAQKKKRVSIEYKYFNTDAEDDDQDYDTHQVSVDAQLPLPRKITIVMKAAGSHKEYGSGREDDKIEYKVEFSRLLYKAWTAALGHEFITNDSDDANSNYERNITFLSLRTAF